MFKELPVNSSIMTDLLDSYVVGNLPESVKLWVDERLAEDASLRQELEMHRLAIAALRDCGKKENSDFGNALAKISKEELIELLSELRQVQEEPAAASAIQKPRAHVFKAWMWKTMAAAAVLGGVWLGTRSFYKGQTAQRSADTYIAVRDRGENARGLARGSDEPLRAEEFNDYSTDSVCLTESLDSVALSISNAEYLLHNGMYQEAISILEPIYKESGGARDVGLLLSAAYIKAKEERRAENVLHALIERYPADPEVEALLNSLN